MRSIVARLRRIFKPVRHTITHLHALAIMPTHRCNCRCIMCDYWKQDEPGEELTLEKVESLDDDLKSLGTPWVILSGGEALMHKGLWPICRYLKSRGHRTSLLTNGLLLKQHAKEISEEIDELIISLDGPREIHNKVRGVSAAFDRLEEGLADIRSHASEAGRESEFEITGRSVLLKDNCLKLMETVETARALGLKRISFLPADISANAFKRKPVKENGPDDSLLPDHEEIVRFRQLIKKMKREHARDFADGFIVERPSALLRMARYFETGISAPLCNAPWIAAVIEADGAVKPCFFHPPYGNLRDGSLEEIINSKKAVAFRKSLNISTNPICRRCVCPLYRP